jgi:hypothetical protein
MQVPIPVAVARPQAPAESYNSSRMSLNQAAEAAAQYPLPPSPVAAAPSSSGRRRDALLPPGDIPGGNSGAQTGYPPREQNFFEKLFGG